MDEELQGAPRKPFDMVSIVFLVLISIFDDATTLIADFTFLIPILGQIALVVSKGTELAVWAFITLWFLFKLHTFGKPGIVNLVGGAAAGLGIPVTTITTIAAIMIANHPEYMGAVGRVAQVASGGEVDQQELAPMGERRADVVREEGELALSRVQSSETETPASQETEPEAAPARGMSQTTEEPSKKMEELFERTPDEKPSTEGPIYGEEELEESREAA